MIMSSHNCRIHSNLLIISYSPSCLQNFSFVFPKQCLSLSYGKLSLPQSLLLETLKRDFRTVSISATLQRELHLAQKRWDTRTTVAPWSHHICWWLCPLSTGSRPTNRWTVGAPHHSAASRRLCNNTQMFPAERFQICRCFLPSQPCLAEQQSNNWDKLNLKWKRMLTKW